MPNSVPLLQEGIPIKVVAFNPNPEDMWFLESQKLDADVIRRAWIHPDLTNRLIGHDEMGGQDA